MPTVRTCSFHCMWMWLKANKYKAPIPTRIMSHMAASELARVGVIVSYYPRLWYVHRVIVWVLFC